MESHLQQARQGPMELTAILVHGKHHIDSSTPLCKTGGAVSVGGVGVTPYQTKQEMGEEPSSEISLGICRAIAMIPTKMLWKWVPNIHSLVSLGPRPSKG